MKSAGLQVRPERLRARRRRLLHGAQRPDAELPLQQLDAGLPLQQGRVQGRRPGPREAADDLARSGAGRGQAQGLRPQVPVHHQLDQLDPAGELLGLAQRAVRHQEQRLRRHSTRAWRSTARCTCATSRTWPTWPRAACSSTRAATTPPTPPSSRASAPWRPAPPALYGSVKRNSKFAYGIGTLPYYPDVPGAPQNTVIGGASLWVMSGKKPEEYKAVAAFFNFLSKPEVRGQEPPAHRLPAGHQGLVRADRQVRLLQAEPRHRRLGEPDDPQDHRQVARRAPGQLRADPHHHRRGTRRCVAGQQAAEGSAGRGREARQRAAGALPESQQAERLRLPERGFAPPIFPGFLPRIQDNSRPWRNGFSSSRPGCPGC